MFLKSLSDDKKQAIKEHLDGLAKRLRKSNGALTAEDVLKEAKKGDNVLSECFEWNAKKAAEKYWLETARAVLCVYRVQVVIHTEEKNLGNITVRTPERVHLKTAKGYVSRATIKKVKNLRASHVEQGKRALRSWLLSYGEYDEFRTVKRAIFGILTPEDVDAVAE